MTWKGFFANHHPWRRWFYPLISVVVALSLCLTTPMPGRAFDIRSLLFRGVQIIQMSNISDRQEVDLGQQMNQQLKSGDIRLSRNSAINRYVEQIGRRLATNSDRANLPFTFQVVEDDAINAFATLGGFVYIHTGLIKAADNEAELASVIAHEIGHIGGRHLVQQMRQRAIAGGVASAAGLDRNAAVGIGVELALNRPRSRQDEFDADNRGLRTLTRAGYAQSAMVSFMQKLMQRGGSVPTFLSTHPGTSDRISALQRSIDAQPSNQRDGLDNAAYRANIRSLL
ncbi:M48 family metallopeptidase [Nostocales cyanobacterium LEGE 11386]|nr:M48 family metallopeptidase [Nostocales cyanobacterium LEGE 11386]